MKKSRVTKSMSKHNLPSVVWTRILSRLPVKSVLRFRSVSKTWLSLIDDPNFCRLHLINFKNNHHETHLFVVQKSGKENDTAKVCVVRSCDTFKTTATLGSLDTSKLGKNWKVVYSFDGLVMIRYGQIGSPTPELILWNPSIRKARILPPSPAITGGLWNVDLGFGYHPLINDYKHVRLVRSGCDNTLHSVAVYTLGTGLWKTVEFQAKEISDWRFTLDYYSSSKLKPVCFQGSLYFIASCSILDNKEKKELVSFDLSDEVFSYTALPVDEDVISDEYADLEDIISDKSARKIVTLVDGGSSLGVVYLLSTKGCIWVYDSDGSWTKRYIFISCIQEIYPEDYTRPKFLCLNKKCEMFFQWFPQQLTSYNLESHDEKNLVKAVRRPEMIDVRVYIESLVLLKG